MPKPQTLDLRFLIEFCHSDKFKMSSYIKTFLESFPEDIEKINSAIEERDWIKTKKLAHALKPQLQFIGLPAFYTMIATLEKTIDDGFNEKESDKISIELSTYTDLAIDALLHVLKSF